MAENTGIQWTTHTFNPWWGCAKVGPGCDHCYAEALDKRTGGDHWGHGKERRRTKDWSGPLRWDRIAAKTGVRPWVFCASMADVFDNEVPDAWRKDAFDLIRSTPNLNWQIVTKRIGNARKMLPADWPYPHVGLIATICNQDEADRDIPKLVETPAAWRGLSCEPLLGPIDLEKHLIVGSEGGIDYAYSKTQFLNWVIIGGESGPGARPFQVSAARDLIEQCRRGGVPVFVKQFGAHPVYGTIPTRLKHPKGADMAEWPVDMRVQRMPNVGLVHTHSEIA